MAKYQTKKNNYKAKKRPTRKSSRSELTSLAYKMGQIERGLKNSESAISVSYNNGKTGASKKSRSLF